MWEPPSCRKVLGESSGSAWPNSSKHKTQREEEAFQDEHLLDHEITDELRARVTERQQKDAANDRKRRTTAQRKNNRLTVMDQQVPWTKFKGKKAWVDIETRSAGAQPWHCAGG